MTTQKIKIRLFTNEPLSSGNTIDLAKEQTHYLTNVMRKKEGDKILLFNGIDGEYIAQIASCNKKSCQIIIQEQSRIQHNEPDIWLCFAPVKNAPLHNIIQKATELGATVLQPVITQNTITERVNTERMQAIAIEASEQSHRLTVPIINEAVSLTTILESWDNSRKIILCDESGSSKPARDVLNNLSKGKYALLTGPEGGFSNKEFEIMRNKDYIYGISMGPRIMRADTAVIAALTCFQIFLGDFDGKPDFKPE